MGFFNPHYDRPGPGVNKNTPRKKGFARFFEVIGRDMSSFFKANAICCVCALPGAIALFLGLLSNSILLIMGGGMIGGMILAPAWTGMHDTVLRSLRDEPGYWGVTYRKAMKNNWKQSLLPGAIVGLLISLQVLMIWFLILGILPATLPTIIILVFNLLITGMVTPFLWSQLVLMDMKTFLVAKNSLLFAVFKAPKALLMAVVQFLYWGAMVLLLFVSPIALVSLSDDMRTLASVLVMVSPVALLLMITLGFAVITIICQMITFPILDQVMHLEERFVARREAELRGEEFVDMTLHSLADERAAAAAEEEDEEYEDDDEDEEADETEEPVTES